MEKTKITRALLKKAFAEDENYVLNDLVGNRFFMIKGKFSNRDFDLMKKNIVTNNSIAERNVKKIEKIFNEDYKLFRGKIIFKKTIDVKNSTDIFNENEKEFLYLANDEDVSKVNKIYFEFCYKLFSEVPEIYINDDKIFLVSASEKTKAVIMKCTNI